MHDHRSLHRRALAAVLTLGLLGASPALAQTVSVTVPGPSSPYLAGMPPGTRCCFGLDEDVVPEQGAVEVHGLPLAGGATLTFDVSGSVSYLAGADPVDPPDGGGFIQESPLELRDGQIVAAASAHGIAGMVAPINGLVGVFLDNNPPNASPAPGRLDFSENGIGTSFQRFCPALKQVFYIGDGRSENGTGAVQRFVVPPGATRLFLGTVDGHGWFTNSGAFSVNVNVGPPLSAFTEINANGESFQGGQTLVLNVHACNPPGNAPVDLFVGALWPDLNTIAFLADPGVFGGIGQLNAPASVGPMESLGGGTAITSRVLDFTFPAQGIPVGVYYPFASLLQPGSLADNALNDGDLAWLGFVPIVYGP